MSEFKVGDTVKLKSGSPAMTITTVGEHYGVPTVWTAWFDGTKKFTGDFPPDALEPYEKRERSGRMTLA